MTRFIFSLAILSFLVFALQSCCEIGTPYPVKITITAIPIQDSIAICGIKNGKPLKKVYARYRESQANFISTSHSFWFQQSLDMSSKQSILAITYRDFSQNFVTDTITVSYKTSATYQNSCGAVVNWSDPKVEKTTFKLPLEVTVE